jgi:hypothetical protein
MPRHPSGLHGDRVLLTVFVPVPGNCGESWETAPGFGEPVTNFYCAVLFPHRDKVTVYAHLGLDPACRRSPEWARIGDEASPYSIDVRYPGDRARITGPGYAAELRTAVDKALAAAAAGWHRADVYDKAKMPRNCDAKTMFTGSAAGSQRPPR